MQRIRGIIFLNSILTFIKEKIDNCFRDTLSQIENNRFIFIKRLLKRDINGEICSSLIYPKQRDWRKLYFKAKSKRIYLSSIVVFHYKDRLKMAVWNLF